MGEFRMLLHPSQFRKDAAKERNIGRGAWVTLRTVC